MPEPKLDLNMRRDLAVFSYRLGAYSCGARDVRSLGAMDVQYLELLRRVSETIDTTYGGNASLFFEELENELPDHAALNPDKSLVELILDWLQTI